MNLHLSVGAIILAVVLARLSGGSHWRARPPEETSLTGTEKRSGLHAAL